METVEQLGAHLRQWRIMLGLPQKLAASRANISLTTLRRIEQGDPGVQIGNFLALTNVLSLNERLVEATDPFQTSLGRMRSHLLAKKRVRSPK